ncbi:hypothetical protein [Rubritalea tangerina]|uniref:hypothetical protein n=1 Tax=Rubritalea tangerina TaxID=430798 RepID=UPI0036095258
MVPSAPRIFTVWWNSRSIVSWASCCFWLCLPLVLTATKRILCVSPTRTSESFRAMPKYRALGKKVVEFFVVNVWSRESVTSVSMLMCWGVGSLALGWWC